MEQNVFLSELSLLAKQLDLDFIILFGSRATSQFSQNSDYDIAYFKSHQTREERKKIYNSFQEVFKDTKFDCVDVSQDIEPRLLFDIFYKGKILYLKDKKMFDTFKDKVLFYYQDSKRLFEPYRKHYLQV